MTHYTETGWCLASIFCSGKVQLRIGISGVTLEEFPQTSGLILINEGHEHRRRAMHEKEATTLHSTIRPMLLGSPTNATGKSHSILVRDFTIHTGYIVQINTLKQDISYPAVIITHTIDV